MLNINTLRYVVSSGKEFFHFRNSDQQKDKNKNLMESLKLKNLSRNHSQSKKIKSIPKIQQKMLF